MIMINNELYEKIESDVSFDTYSVTQNKIKRKGISPFISFKCNNKYIGIEMTYDKEWLIQMKKGNKENITKYISDIIYEDEKGFTSLIYENHYCYLEKINDLEYKIQLNCEIKYSEIYSIHIDENIIINS